MLILDRSLSALLVLGAVGHTFGVTEFYRDQPHALFWSLCAGLLIVVIATLNVLRTYRPDDLAVGWIAVGFTIAYLVVTIGFGRLIGNMADFRVITFGLVCSGLVGFGVSNILRSKG